MPGKFVRTARLRLSISAALAGLVLSTAIATGQSPADPAENPAADSPDELQLEVRRLVRQLDADQLIARDEAEKELIAEGPAILPWLPKPDARMTEEVKHRLARVRQKVEQDAAERAASATTVTLKVTESPLSLVLANFEKQTGNKLSFGNAGGEQVNETPITLDVDGADFWPALDQTLDQANLTVYHYSQPATLTLRSKPTDQRPRHGSASYSGPFRIEALQARALRDLRGPTNRNLRLQVEIAWEPRLAPIAMTLSLDDIRAEDEHGNLLPTSDQSTMLPVEVHAGTTAVELEIPFALPPRSATKIAKLTGTIHALVPGRVESFRFDNIETADQTEQRQGGVTVILDTVLENNDLWDVRMRVRYDEATGALESHRGWVYRNPRYIVNAEGERFEDWADETIGQTDTEIGFAFAFDLPNGPAGLSFVYETPAVIVRMPVEFELTDIDLP